MARGTIRVGALGRLEKPEVDETAACTSKKTTDKEARPKETSRTRRSWEEEQHQHRSSQGEREIADSEAVGGLRLSGIDKIENGSCPIEKGLRKVSP